MGYVTEYAYDAVGNLISATLPNGETYAIPTTIRVPHF